MSVDELAEELADFWLSALADADWSQRLHILNEMHAQLLLDLESKAEYEAVSPLFVAAIIDRLGETPVENGAQAKVYSLSAREHHRDAAKAWRYGADALEAQLAAGFVERDRRRHPRKFVDVLSEIWVHGRPAPCRLVDVSLGGAQVVVRAPAPEPGTQIRLSVPDTGTRDAMVVFRNRMGIGVQFLGAPAAA